MDRSKKKLSLMSFFAITASMVMTVYDYPTFATSKMNLVFCLLVGGFLSFIPVALCSAEMATVEGWEKSEIWRGNYRLTYFNIFILYIVLPT